jgi:prepilin-type processing-associated H-X9-DG protein
MIGEIYSAGWTRFGQYRYTRYFINPHNLKTQIAFADTHVGTMPVYVQGANPDPRQYGIDFWE